MFVEENSQTYVDFKVIGRAYQAVFAEAEFWLNDFGKCVVCIESFNRYRVSGNIKKKNQNLTSQETINPFYLQLASDIFHTYLYISWNVS